MLLISSGVLMGHRMAQRLWDRADALRELSAAAELLRGELAARRSLQSVCTRYGGSLPGMSGAFFRLLGAGLDRPDGRTLEEIWCMSVSDAFGQMLSPREIKPFCRLWAALHTGAGMEDSLCRCIDQLERMARQAEDTARQDGRLWTGLGLALGAALAIVLA